MKIEDSKLDDGKFNLLVFRALEFFIKNPYEEIHLRKFSRRLKISPNSAQRFLNLFLKEGFVVEERKAHLRYFKANLESLVFRFIKKTYSVKELEKSGLIDYLKEKCSSVVLFGSVAKGLDDENSDVDLVCIVVNKDEIKKNLIEIQEKVDREVNCHVFTWAEWKEQVKKNKAFYQDVIIDGINLIGEIPIAD
jgi:predicted nucleotidyltransferase